MSTAPPGADAAALAGALPVRRWRVGCAYDGTDFGGWQSQPGGRAVQDVVEERLQTIFGQPVRIHGSGRTDAGVHARGQVFHFDAAWRHDAETLHRALDRRRPESLRLGPVTVAPPGFHARFSAVGKRYSYRLTPGLASPFAARFCWSLGQRAPLAVGAMREAAAALVGTRRFGALAALRGDGSDPTDTTRTLHRAEIRQSGEVLTIIYEADGFLYKMARSLTGALVEVGRGRLAVAELLELVEGGTRTAAIPSAPAQGLCLEKVYYRRPRHWTLPPRVLPDDGDATE